MDGCQTENLKAVCLTAGCSVLYMCHAEAVSEAGVVLLEKSRLYLDLFNSDVSSVDILVTLWHNDQLNAKKDFDLLCTMDTLRKFKRIIFSFSVNFYKMAFIVFINYQTGSLS